MTNLSPTISNAFSYYFQDFLERVQVLSDDLSDTEFWTNPYPYGNSIGHLVLHIMGNLNYYIGAQLAATGYVRDRAREFTESAPPTKAQKQQDGDWATAYMAAGVDDVPDRFSMFLRAAVHFHHHIGHMSYVRDEHLRRRAGGL